MDAKWNDVMMNREGFFYRFRMRRRLYIGRKKQSSSGLGLGINAILFTALRGKYHIWHRTVMFSSGVEYMSVCSDESESRTGVDSDIQLNRPVAHATWSAFQNDSHPLHLGSPFLTSFSFHAISNLQYHQQPQHWLLFWQANTPILPSRSELYRGSLTSQKSYLLSRIHQELLEISRHMFSLHETGAALEPWKPRQEPCLRICWRHAFLAEIWFPPFPWLSCKKFVFSSASA